jgi:hypothetical protein
MKEPTNEVINALDQIVKWSSEREIPPGEWVAPLQDVLKGKDAIILGAKLLPVPLAVFDRNGIVELANDRLLDGIGMTAEYIKEGRADIYGVESLDFRNAVKLALRGETSVVGGLNNPFMDFGTGYADENPKIKSAIIFPVIEDNATILRGAVLFLPFEYRPDNA